MFLGVSTLFFLKNFTWWQFLFTDSDSVRKRLHETTHFFQATESVQACVISFEILFLSSNSNAICVFISYRSHNIWFRIYEFYVSHIMSLNSNVVILHCFTSVIVFSTWIYTFFAEERTSLARVYVTLVCCELLWENGTNPKTAACILVFVTALHDATAAVSEAAIAKISNAHLEDRVRFEEPVAPISLRELLSLVSTISKCKSEIFSQYRLISRNLFSVHLRKTHFPHQKFLFWLNSKKENISETENFE